MFTVVIPVGPDDAELPRLVDLLASLEAHRGPTRPHVVLVDDSPRPRALEAFWGEAQVLRTGLWPKVVPDPLSAMVAGTIEGLKAARGTFALKLDTDALVIAPFAEKIQSAFVADPSLGIVGAYDRSPDGSTRDWSRWPPVIRRGTWAVNWAPRTRAIGWLPRIRPRVQRRLARNVIGAALANPSYELGAHCLGGAYAVSAALLAHAPSWEWPMWAHTGLAEDVVLGLLCAAAGKTMRGLVDEEDPFGVAWRGLPADPPDLVNRGYSIVHSLKSENYGREAELREWFRLHTR